MKPITIHKTIEIAGSPQQVWHYIGTAMGLSRWWDVAVTMEEKVGGQFAEEREENGRLYRRVGEVVTYEPPRKLAIRSYSTEAERDWPAQSEIEIGLEGDNSQTTVTIIHRAFGEEIEAVGTEQYLSCNPNAATLSGPTMALPAAAGSVMVSSVMVMGQTCVSTPPTLHDLYQWRHQQELVWQRRFATLPTLVAKLA